MQPIRSSQEYIDRVSLVVYTANRWSLIISTQGLSQVTRAQCTVTVCTVYSTVDSVTHTQSHSGDGIGTPTADQRDIIYRGGV
jgi:hypothetical protein